MDSYLPKLVRAGKRVAICDQLEDPKLTKKLVKRGITELVTPGVSINDNILNHKENNFLAAIHFGKDVCGIAFLDISTGEFLTAEGTVDYVDKLLNNFSPKEVLVERGSRKRFEEAFGPRFFIFELDDWVFTSEAANDRLLKHFETKNLKGFGVQHLKLGIVASGAILYYLDQTQHTHILISPLFPYRRRPLCAPRQVYGAQLRIGQHDERRGYELAGRTGQDRLADGIAYAAPLDLVPVEGCETDPRASGRSGIFLPSSRSERTVRRKIRTDRRPGTYISKVAVGRVSPREVVQLKVALRAIEPIKEACMAKPMNRAFAVSANS